MPDYPLRFYEFMVPVTRYDRHRIACFDPEAAPDFSFAYFDPEYWHDHQSVIGKSTGRGITWFVRQGRAEWVLRHYWRGGMIGKLVADQFVYTGLARTRSFIEFELLNQLLAEDLPVPRPIAAQVTRYGCFYRADLLIERIPDAQDLVQILQERELTSDEWKSVGSVLAQFHFAGAYHADLNAHNILLDARGKVWVLDFDKGAIRHSGVWQEQNLERLQRSFHKEKKLHSRFYWSASDWETLMLAYQFNR